MRYCALASLLYALTAHAAPAPQADTAAMPTIEGPEGICSSAGEYWDGLKYVTCGELRFCRNNGCDWETPPVAAGVSAPAVAATGQATAVGAGADGPMVSAQQSGSSSVTSVSVSASSVVSSSASDITFSASTASSVVQSAAGSSVTSLPAGTGQTTAISSSASNSASTSSGTTSAVAASETGAGAVADPNCVDDKYNELVALKRSPSDKWEMTGPECAPRTSGSTEPRFVAYWSQWSLGANKPAADQLKGVTHLILSFAGVNLTASPEPQWTNQSATEASPFASPGHDIVDQIKNIQDVNPNIKVMAAFGGWNLDAGFAQAADGGTMEPLAQAIVNFKDKYHLDGIDIDWEYPVGGGAFYKSCHITTEDHKLPERPYERDALVDLFRHIRHLAPETHLSVAAPAKKGDRELSFPKEIITEIDKCLDDWNLMTYDMMNRRDTKTTHHAGSAVIKDVVDYYHSNGIEDQKKMNIGFSLYAKYFTLSNSTSEACESEGGLGCDISPAEGPAGQDLGTSGAWVFDQPQNPLFSVNVATDYTLKLAKPSWDSMPDEATTSSSTAGASSWADIKNRMFWTWTSPSDIKKSCDDHMADVGGVMVWSINQDGNGVSGGPHMEAIAGCLGGGSSGGDTTASGSSSTSGAGVSSTSASGQTSASTSASSVSASASVTSAY